MTIAGREDPQLCLQEPAPPDAGILVFLNNDDDNQNGIVDHDEHGPFQDGQGAAMDDDELVAVSVSCTLSGFIIVASYDARIGLYSSRDKADELGAWACWSDCAGGCRPMSEWTGAVYVEGREGSGSLGDIALTASCGTCDENYCTEQAKLTVLKVERLYWDEHQLAPQNTALDWCENNDGRRIFPDLLFPGDTQAALRRKVDLVAEVKPAVADVEIFFRVWDVDDPFDQLNAAMPDVALIDPTNPTSGPDNRPNPEAPWSTSAMTWANGKAAIPYTVALQPGNNYRAGAALTYGALGQNTIQNGQTLDPQQQADALSAKFPTSPGSWEGYELPLTWSEMLTVWRKLHVETDSMGPVTGNEIITNITDFVGTGTAVTQVTVADSLDDGSPNLDSSPPGNGRFENGHLFVGSGGSDMRIDSLVGNGNSRVVFASTSFAGQPFHAVDNDSLWGSSIDGTITQITKSGSSFIWTLNITVHSEEPIDWPDFVGGTVSVGWGAAVEIIAANGLGPQLTTSAMAIRCEVRDDDNGSLLNEPLPKLPDVSALAAAYLPAYVVPVFDVGDSNMNVPFVLNSGTTLEDWDSKPLNSNSFWVAYLLMAYQRWVYVDNDPNSESAHLGETRLDGGSVIHFEVHQLHEDVANPTTEEQVTVVHESGHAVGRSGDHPVTTNNDTGSAFVTNYLVHIRESSRPRP